jgi:hypothetical protein
VVGDGKVVLSLVDDFRHGSHAVWGISARNREQNFALNALMDPEIDFVTLLGTAGTGKTLLALAAGLAQTMDQQRYREIIMTRATVSVGEDIGFLPGTEEEDDAVDGRADRQPGSAHAQPGRRRVGRAATNDLLASRIKIRSMNFMRGRTFLSRYLILDEAQNLTPKQMKTLITRAGPGTKIVCLGNVEQIDTPYLTETTSGLTYAVDRFKNWPHSAHHPAPWRALAPGRLRFGGVVNRCTRLLLPTAAIALAAVLGACTTRGPASVPTAERTGQSWVVTRPIIAAQVLDTCSRPAPAARPGGSAATGHPAGSRSTSWKRSCLRWRPGAEGARL